MTHGTRTEYACLQSALDGIAASARKTEAMQWFHRNSDKIDAMLADWKAEKAAEERGAQ